MIIGCVACSTFSQKEVLVVESLEKIRSRHIPSLVREKVWKCDGGRCVLCGSREDL